MDLMKNNHIYGNIVKDLEVELSKIRKEKEEEDETSKQIEMALKKPHTTITKYKKALTKFKKAV